MVISGLSSAFGERLQATSLWAGKALCPPEMKDAAPRGLQSAINDGWPANVGCITSLLPLAAAAVGFLHKWWVGLAILAGWFLINYLVSRTRLVPRSVDWYLLLFVNHANRRHANFVRDGDLLRAEAAEELSNGLQRLLDLYVGTGVLAPTITEARSAPMGDESYLRL